MRISTTPRRTDSVWSRRKDESMQIVKAAAAVSCGAPTPEQLEKINALGRGNLCAEDVYVFSVRLCDDQPDREFERFDTASLGKLGELFRGKTGVTDHDWSADKQLARIFDTEVAFAGNVSYLKAWCYCLRSEEELVAQIEAGIKKEVSVGCSMGKKTCSICGSPYGSCEHRKGQVYDGRTCLAVLSEPLDAYEFSFVAVPAQPMAGVRKGMHCAQEPEREKLKALGEAYLAELRREVERLTLSLELDLEEPVLHAITGMLDAQQLGSLKSALKKRFDERFTGPVQLGLHMEQPFTGIEPEYRI